LVERQIGNEVFPNTPVVLRDGESPDHTEILVSEFDGHMYALVSKIPKALMCQGLCRALETNVTQTQAAPDNTVCELVPRPGRRYLCDKTGPDVSVKLSGAAGGLRYGMRLVTKSIGTGFPADVSIHVDLLRSQNP
jgi:hypothetical protein